MNQSDILYEQLCEHAKEAAVGSGLVESKSEYDRLVQQGAVSLSIDSFLLKIGKRRFLQVTCKN